MMMISLQTAEKSAGPTFIIVTLSVFYDIMHCSFDASFTFTAVQSKLNGQRQEKYLQCNRGAPDPMMFVSFTQTQERHR